MRSTVLPMAILAGYLAIMLPASANSPTDPAHHANASVRAAERLDLERPAAAQASDPSPTEAKTTGTGKDIAPVGSGWG